MNKHQQTRDTVAIPPTETFRTADLETWDIDPARSSLRFSLRHLVVSEIRGRFHRWGGTLIFARNRPTIPSTINVWVDLSTIDTGDPERDAHVRSSEFLDVAHLPRAEFEANDVEAREGRAVLHGRLGLHGVMHDVDVEVEPHVAPMAGEKNAYLACATFDRRGFGLRWNQDLDVGGVVVGDEIRISAELVLVRRTGDV
jgi:polyisoprenoid-binding protein YceI